MTFVHKNVIISGSTSGVDSAAALLQEISGVMVAAGWTVEDDRSAVPTTFAGATKIVFRSNGENNDLPTFYATAFSGTSTAAGGGIVAFAMHTAYDVGTHAVPASGVVTAQGVPIANNSVSVIANEISEVWISANAEYLVVVTRDEGNAYDSAAYGRVTQFTSLDQDPFPLFVNAEGSQGVTATNVSQVQGIAGNPPVASTTSNQAVILSFNTLTSTNQPYNMSGANSIFVAGPLLFAKRSNTGSPGQGLIGMVPGHWEGAGTAANMLPQARLTASGTGGVQTYRAFPIGTTFSLIMRES